jgi:hypothetical protein
MPLSSCCALPTTTGLEDAMSLGRYPIEVKAIADELLEYLDGPLRASAERIVNDRPESIWQTTIDVFDDAIALLGKTPSQRKRAVKNCDEATALLVLRARYAGLQAWKAMVFVESFMYASGSSYRDAARRAARSAVLFDPRPSMKELLPEKSATRSGFRSW